MGLDEILGYSVNRACEVIPCGRTKLYKLIAAGQLDARKLGSKTIITAESVVRFHEELPPADIGPLARDGAAEDEPAAA